MKNWFVTCVIIGTLSILASGCSKRDVFNSKKPMYLEVVQRVQKGEIKVLGLDTNTGSPIAVALPQELQAASVDGSIYGLNVSTNQQLVVFKTWRGKGANMEGFLYATRPLSAGDIHKDYHGDNTVSIGSIDYVLDGQVDTNWYRVSYRLD